MKEATTIWYGSSGDDYKIVANEIVDEDGSYYAEKDSLTILP